MVYSEYSPEPESHPWWVYALVIVVGIVLLPVWILVALVWWFTKGVLGAGVGGAGAAVVIPWWPWHKRTPAQEQHGRRG